MEALEYFIRPAHYELSSFCAEAQNKVPLTTLRRFLKDCKIFEMKRAGRPVGDADKALKEKLLRRTENGKRRVQAANQATRYLTNNEELAIVQVVRILAGAGSGVSPEELLMLTNEYIHHHADSRMIEPATKKTIRGMLGRHKGLAKIVSTSSMDPKRAEQATKSHKRCSVLQT